MREIAGSCSFSFFFSFLSLLFVSHGQKAVVVFLSKEKRKKREKKRRKTTLLFSCRAGQLHRYIDVLYLDMMPVG